MSHKILRPFIVNVSVRIIIPIGYFPQYYNNIHKKLNKSIHYFIYFIYLFECN